MKDELIHPVNICEMFLVLHPLKIIDFNNLHTFHAVDTFLAPRFVPLNRGIKTKSSVKNPEDLQEVINW